MNVLSEHPCVELGITAINLAPFAVKKISGQGLVH